MGVCVVAPAHAQFPALTGSEGVVPIGVKRVGHIETTAVELEGLPLFEIASPLVPNHEKPEGGIVPVEVRATAIENHLDRVLETLLASDKGTTQAARTALELGLVRIEIVAVEGQTALVAKGDLLVQTENLMTLTALDAEFHQTPREELAKQWRDKVNTSLSAAIREHRPDALKEHKDDIQGLAIAVPLIHAFLYGISWLVLRRQQQIRTEIEAHNAAPANPAGGEPPATTEEESDDKETETAKVAPAKGTAPVATGPHGWLTYSLSLENKFRFLAFLRWLLFSIVFALWIFALTLALFLFPHTRKFGIYLTATPLLLVIALFAATLINRITDLMVDRALASWQANRLFEGVDIKHISSRLSTLSAAIRAMKMVVLYCIAIIWVLSRLAIVPWSIVTIGALVALTLSFTVQSLVKDVVMGALILIEDQYVIGDYITIQDVTGTVEYMNLRITRLRPADGRLVTIPNSSITKVENLSKNWSLTTVEFEVAPSTNADKVLERARGIARQMAEEPEWKETILNSDEWAGISKLSLTALTVVIAVRTRPLDHWKVSRELRRRIKNALDQGEIVPGKSVEAPSN